MTSHSHSLMAVKPKSHRDARCYHVLLRLRNATMAFLSHEEAFYIYRAKGGFKRSATHHHHHAMPISRAQRFGAAMARDYAEKFSRAFYESHTCTHIHTHTYTLFDCFVPSAKERTRRVVRMRDTCRRVFSSPQGDDDYYFGVLTPYSGTLWIDNYSFSRCLCVSTATRE